jgi:hypothetical protein
MDTKDIIKQANIIYNKNKEQILPHFFFVAYISLLAQYLKSGLFSFFVSIFLCSLSHGFIKISMRIVDEEKPIITLKDSLIGIVEFPRVFPIYFTRKLTILLIVILSILPTLLNFTYITPLLNLSFIANTGNNLIQTEFFIPDINIILSLMQRLPLLINTLLSSILYFLLTCLFSFMPYILEDEELSWLEAFKQSFVLMKGKMWMVIQLLLSYSPIYIIYWIITGMIYTFIGSINEIAMLICLVLSLFVYIHFIRGRLEIAKYLLYKKIRGEK